MQPMMSPQALKQMLAMGIVRGASWQCCHREGFSPEESMIKAGERRLRPIMMTALATVAGMIPLALAIGAGSQMLQPLAIAVIGGIIASMVLSLVITPAVHYYLADRTIG